MKMPSIRDKRNNYGIEKDMVKEMNLSIIIVNFMTRELLKSCLNSILDEKDIKYEIIVVDNSSSDESLEIVMEDFPSAYLIKNQKNVGFAKACNNGIKHATGKYILLLNPDTELMGSTVNMLVSYMENNKDVSAAGCKVLNPDGSVQLSCGYLPSIASVFWGGEKINRIYRKMFPNSTFFGACGITSDRLDERHEVENLLGACVILRRSVLDEIGCFDENMFMYFEECDLFYRIRRAGGKIMYIPDAEIMHHAGGSTKSIKKVVGYYQKSQEYYFIKNLSLKNINIFRIMIVISAIIKTTLLYIMYMLKKRNDGNKIREKMEWQWNTIIYYVRIMFPAGRMFEDEI